MKNLVLLGGGYGNMRIMSHILPNALPADYTLTLVDRMPYHGLKPEFYALAAGTKSDTDVRMNFPESERINTIYGEITDINLDDQIISVGQTKVDYDELVIDLAVKINIIMFLALTTIRIVSKHYLKLVKHFIKSANCLLVPKLVSLVQA